MANSGFERVRLQLLQRDKFERGRVRRFEIDRRRNSMIKRFLPACHANAPLVAGFQARKFPVWMWRDEIISLQHRKIQKLARHSCANRVKPNVARPGLAEAIPIKSGTRILTAILQLRSQNIRRHAWTISPALVRCTIVVPAKL